MRPAIRSSVRPNALPELTDQKIIYNDSQTGFEVIYDKEGDYFRMRNTSLTGKRTFTDLTGLVPNNIAENGKQRGRTNDEYQKVTHFINTDRK